MFNPFLVVYYGSDSSGGWQSLERPLRTITTLDRFGLVTWEGRVPMLRMLQVSELQRAMGFRSDYKLDVIGPRREKIRILGNGVTPPVMTSIVQGMVADVPVKLKLPPGLPRGKCMPERFLGAVPA